ncbi:MAG: 50S ribosomal protein L31 [Candidatus Margulisiibacteriota bacterium]
MPYHSITVSCACGAEFAAGSTKDTIRVDICSNCHPFFTGEARIMDTEGRVEKFRKKYNLSK